MAKSLSILTILLIAILLTGFTAITYYKKTIDKNQAILFLSWAIFLFYMGFNMLYQKRYYNAIFKWCSEHVIAHDELNQRLLGLERGR